MYGDFLAFFLVKRARVLRILGLRCVFGVSTFSASMLTGPFHPSGPPRRLPAPPPYGFFAFTPLFHWFLQLFFVIELFWLVL